MASGVSVCCIGTAFETRGAKIQTVISDNGRVFCGRPDRHPYEHFLQLEEIDRRTTRVHRPQSNGFIERRRRTLLDEHFRVMGRKKFYETVDEMQRDLEIDLKHYNEKRPHQGRMMKGRTPAAACVAGLKKTTPAIPSKESVQEASTPPQAA